MAITVLDLARSKLDLFHSLDPKRHPQPVTVCWEGFSRVRYCRLGTYPLKRYKKKMHLC